jgi:NitT/TauT family transport system substrate-binding protein
MDHRMNLPRRRVLALGAASMLPALWPGRSQAKVPRLVLAGPFAGVSNALIRIVDGGALGDVADQVDFRVWKDPNQLRALALEGAADFVAMPSNVAANLYNRGVKLRLLNISAWGMLFVVSRDEKLRTLDDLKGQELLMPFRGDMPDIVFQTLAAKLGFKVGKDLVLRYVATPLDALQMLLTRRADHALLAEPAVSMGVRKSQTLPISVVAPDLHRGIDIQREWGRAFQRAPRIPQAGIVVMSNRMADTALIERFQQAYAQAMQWCHANADECGRAVAKRIDMLTPEGVADAVRADGTTFKTATQAREELEFFFELLHARQPGLVGGKLPPDDFYQRG